MEKYNLKQALEVKYGKLRTVKKPPLWLFNHLFNTKEAYADHPLYFSGHEGVATIYIVVSNQYDDKVSDEYWNKIEQLDERYNYSFERPFFYTTSKKILNYVKSYKPELLNVYVKRMAKF